VFGLLADAIEGFALLGHALETIALEDERRAKLSKAAAARAAQLERDFREALALLPQRPGRRLEDLEGDFLQFVKTLHDDLGWGRPRIFEAAKRDFGATEWQVRRALERIAGGNGGSSDG